MNKWAQKLCTICGPVGFVLFGIGLFPLAKFLPPPSPAATAEQISAIYSSNQLGIQLGAIVIMMSASLFIPFFSMITVIIKRIEGQDAPLAVTQIASAIMVVVFFFSGAMLFAVTAFRPERSAELTQLMNDFAWIMFISPGAPAFVQTAGIGLAILSDKQALPVLPRWFGYLSLWIAILFVPAELAVIFKTGPFAWNGLLSFWVPAILVGGWSMMMAILMFQSINKRAVG